MFRKSSALMFMLVMTLLIALKHPVLGYCLCSDAYITSSSSCFSNEASPCSGCSEIKTNVAPEPCTDCVEHFSIDVDDFLWEASDDSTDTTKRVELPLVQYPSFDNIARNAYIYSPTAIRGDPPPGVNENDISSPILLRLGVFLL